MSKEQFLARYGSAKHVDELMSKNPNTYIRDAILENPFASDTHVKKIFDHDKQYRIPSHIIRSLLNREPPPTGLHEHIIKHNYDGNIFKKTISTANKDQLDHIARYTSYNGADTILDKIVEHPLADNQTFHNLMMNQTPHVVRHFMDDPDIKPEHLETVYHNHTDHGLQFDAITHEKAPISILKDASENHPRKFIKDAASEILEQSLK